MSEFDHVLALSFDCYGTLIDWERGIAAALRPWATRNGLDLDDEALIAAHARHETNVQRQMPTALYPDVLAETLRRIGRDYGSRVSDRDAGAYGASVGDWPAFSDSAAALGSLGEHFTLIILSNVDRASFARSNQRLGIAFDLVITAEDVGSYKPAVANFHALLAGVESLGVDRDALVHVAESLYHDHASAAEIGLPSVWIHRRHGKRGFGATTEPLGRVEPRWRFDSLADFAKVATGETT